ncbi:MAG: formylglycine-generating enzyme family protein, partial [Magnetococcales bacterium]|nr:formylglycine-generating enzyme family protein [Magnetococcales bacterium]
EEARWKAEAKEWRDPVTGMEFVKIPGGCFQMGSPGSEKDSRSTDSPVHEVCVGTFWLGKYEVTNREYRVFKVGHNSWEYKGLSLNGDSQPVVEVSWEEATAYAEWLSGKGNGMFRLPTEAEWEYAARGGTKSSRYWGNDPKDACKYANVADRTAKAKWSSWIIYDCMDGYEVTAPVGRFAANPFGLYDMLGNVWEWVSDWYGDNYYEYSPRNNPQGPSGGSRWVIRGGSWFSYLGGVRSASRGNFGPGDHNDNLGFRLARAIGNKASTEPNDLSSAPAVQKESTQGKETNPTEGLKGPKGVESKKGPYGIEFVRVPGGSFRMGSNDGDVDEKPVHGVSVSGFEMGKYEVTQGQWKAVMGSNPSFFGSCGDSCPMEKVSWNDTQEFIKNLNNDRRDTCTYRLPTEAEWEYACRSGGQDEKYCGGNDVDRVAWYAGHSLSKTHPVGLKTGNGLGLYDMSGNVFEWVSDWYGDKYYAISPRDNPQGPSGGSYRVNRGGGWFGGVARSADRDYVDPGYRNNSLGFRLARTCP